MQAWKACGKFKVGYVDVDWVEQASSRNGKNEAVQPYHVDPTQHLAGRLYYPATETKLGALGFWGTSWIPSFRYAYGMANFVFFRRPKGLLYFMAKQIVMLLAYILGLLQRVDMHHGVPIVKLSRGVRFPVVIVSHGLGGHRAIHSIICCELASQGYVALAVEHADGTASASRLARNHGWQFYRGLGGEAGQYEKTRNRVKEMKTALEVIRSLNRGDPITNIGISARKMHAKISFKGCLDLRCIAACGHSYGGATVAAFCAEEPLVRCGICLDPWWPALYPESKALSEFRTKCPIMVLGSHDWNVPDKSGHLTCDESRQESVLNAASTRATKSNGGGAMLLVIAGSSHNTFADLLPLFSEHVEWVFHLLGMSARLDPVLGAHMVNLACLNFFSNHLPLSSEQRELQTWAPSVSTSESALEQVRRLKQLDQNGKSGIFSWLFPGRGLLYTISDYMLDRLLETIRQESRSSGNKNPSQNNDFISTAEVMESSMPSAEPSLGHHPHAPSQCMTEFHHISEEGSSESLIQSRIVAGIENITLRNSIGKRYSNCIMEDQIEEYQYLLGCDAIFTCEIKTLKDRN